MRRTRVRTRRLSTGIRHFDIVECAAGGDAEVVDIGAHAAAFIEPAVEREFSGVAGNELIDGDRRAPEGRQVGDRLAG